MHESVELWLQNRELARPLDAPRLAYDTLFTFEQLGGLAGVARWLTVAQKFKPALDSLLTLRIGGSRYVEADLQHMVQAAETFHRLRFPNYVQPPEEYKAFKRALVKQVDAQSREWLHQQLQYSNEPRLKARLLDLAALAGEPFQKLVADVEVWADTPKDARNSLVHHDDDRGRPTNGVMLHHLSESLFYLVVICLLRQCEASDDVLSTLSSNRRFQWLSQALVRVMAEDVAPPEPA